MQVQGSSSKALVAEITEKSDIPASKICAVVKSKGPVRFG